MVTLKDTTSSILVLRSRRFPRARSVISSELYQDLLIFLGFRYVVREAYGTSTWNGTNLMLNMIL